MEHQEYSLILSTCPQDQASKLAHHLVQNRYAACVNITSSITSVYHWNNQVCEDQESLLFIKTTQSQVSHCIQALKKVHPYDVPEILSFSIDAQRSLPAYLKWISDSVDQVDSSS